MPFQVQCPNSGRVLSCPDHLAGQAFACPACGQLHQLPALAAPLTAQPPAPQPAPIPAPPPVRTPAPFQPPPVTRPTPSSSAMPVAPPAPPLSQRRREEPAPEAGEPGEADEANEPNEPDEPRAPRHRRGTSRRRPLRDRDEADVEAAESDAAPVGRLPPAGERRMRLIAFLGALAGGLLVGLLIGKFVLGGGQGKVRTTLTAQERAALQAAEREKLRPDLESYEQAQRAAIEKRLEEWEKAERASREKTLAAGHPTARPTVRPVIRPGVPTVRPIIRPVVRPLVPPSRSTSAPVRGTPATVRPPPSPTAFGLDWLPELPTLLPSLPPPPPPTRRAEPTPTQSVPSPTRPAGASPSPARPRVYPTVAPVLPVARPSPTTDARSRLGNLLGPPPSTPPPRATPVARPKGPTPTAPPASGNWTVVALDAQLSAFSNKIKGRWRIEGNTLVGTPDADGKAAISTTENFGDVEVACDVDFSGPGQFKLRLHYDAKAQSCYELQLKPTKGQSVPVVLRVVNGVPSGSTEIKTTGTPPAQGPIQIFIGFSGAGTVQVRNLRYRRLGP